MRLENTRRRRLVVELGVIVAAALVTGPAAAAVKVVVDLPDPCTGVKVPHPSIAILGDDGFTLPTSGVRFGSGTPVDPYVICGWDIVPQGVDGILLKDTTASVVVRDNAIHDSLVEVKFFDTSGGIPLDKRIRAGVYAYNADNVVIQGNAIERMDWIVSATLCDCFLIPGADGVAVEFSDNVQVLDNLLADNSAYGARLRESTNVVACGNTIQHNTGHGIGVFGIPGIVICENTLSDNHAPSSVRISASFGAKVKRNTIVDAGFTALGISFGSHESEVEENTITGGWNGVYVQGATGVVLRDNNIVGNANFGVESINVPVDARENWWGCVEGPGMPGCDKADAEVQFVPWLTEPVEP